MNEEDTEKTTGEIVDFDDLVEQARGNGFYLKKFSDIPFTGRARGRGNGNIKNGKQDGLWECYYESGRLKAKGNYKNGKRDGFWVICHGSGQKWELGHFQEGKKERRWQICNEDGQLVGEEDYEGGKLVSARVSAGTSPQDWEF